MNAKFLAVLCIALVAFAFTASAQLSPAGYKKVAYKTIRVEGLDIFYREAGNPHKPALLLLHGFPSSSFMYRDLINDLADHYHLIAPDYPGFGLSGHPAVSAFEYSFDHLAVVMEHFISRINLKRFSLYLQDYGGPVGFRIAAKHPEWISALIIQNANAYHEGLGTGFKAIMALEDAGDKAGVENILKSIISVEGIRTQYTQGANNPAHINPDAYLMDQQLITGEANESIQNALFQNYHINLTKYAGWQQYFRHYQPPALIIWGKNDPIFIAPGGLAYQRDLQNAEVHLLNGGHFALVEYHAEIAAYIRSFLISKGIR